MEIESYSPQIRGQSRSLMIADTALLSPASVVLIDEIENAGIDKVRSLELLVSIIIRSF